MKRPEGSKSTFYLIAILLLLVSLIWNNSIANRMRDLVNILNSSHRFVGELQTLQTRVPTDATLYRNYISTGSTDHLINLEKTIASRKALLNSTLENGTFTDRETEYRRMGRGISLLSDSQMVFFDRGMTVLKKEPAKAVTRDSLLQNYVQQGDKITRSLISSIDSLIKDEENYLVAQNKTVGRFTSQILLLNLITGLLAIGFIIWAGINFFREEKSRQKAQEESDKYRYQLEQRIVDLDNANRSIEELKEEEKYSSTGRIARVIAHEVKNPITNINLATDQLEESIESNEDTEMMLGIIKRNTERINQLISNLLNATKFMDLKFTDQNVHTLLNEAIDELNERLMLTETKLIRNFSAPNPIYSFDGEKMKIGFMNLIVNSIEAMVDNKSAGKNSVINITTRERDQRLEIVFTDNGKGMEPKVLNTIFEVFFTDKEKGSGLGLSNTRNIVKNHGGKITVQSKKNEGSEFTLSFPLS